MEETLSLQALQPVQPVDQSPIHQGRATNLTPTNQLQQLNRISPFFEYFAQINPLHSLSEIEQKYNRTVQNKLEGQIQGGKVLFGPKKKRFNLEKQVPPSQQELLVEEKNQWESRKRDALEALREVYTKEKELLQRSHVFRRGKGRSLSSLELGGPNWLEQVRQAIKKHRNFKSSLKNKCLQAQQRQLVLKKQEIARRQSLIKRIQQKNGKDTQKRIEDQNKSKQQQELNQKKCHDFISNLKPKQYQHQRLQAQMTQLQQQAEKQWQSQLQDFKRRRQVEDWPSLRQHQHRYQEYLSERRDIWIQQFIQMREQHRSRLKQYRGLYADRAKEQQEALKEAEAREAARSQQMLTKIKHYNEYVSEHFKPKKIRNFSNPQVQGTSKRRQLNRSQIRSRGLEYLSKLKEAVRSYKVLPKEAQFKEQKVASLPKIKSQTTYKNYLRQQPIKHRKINDIDQFHSALTQRTGDWAVSALDLIQKMQSQNRTSKGNSLISSALNKVQLLKAMYSENRWSVMI